MGSVTIKGKARFQKQLARLGPAIVDELKPILKENALELEAAIRPDVPRGPTGDLLVTLDAYEVTDSDGQAWRVVEGAERSSRGKGFYATFLEFGTSKQPGSPHFFFHLRRRKARFRSRLARALKRALQRNFQNGA